MFRFGEVSKGPGYVKFGSDSLPLSNSGTAGLRVMALIDFTTLAGTTSYLALTLKDAFTYTAATKRWQAMGVVAEDCEDAWTAAANVTQADDATDYKVGAKCRKLTTDGAGGFTAGGVVGYEVVALGDLTGDDRVHYWIKSDTILDAGDLIMTFSNANDLSTSDATVNVPALAADTWYYISSTIDMSSANSVDSVGLDSGAGFPDTGTVIVRIDDIRTSTAFTNTANNQWTWCSQAGAGTVQESAPTWFLILTNGVDAPYKWNGSAVEFTALTGTLDTGTLTTSKVTASYKDTLGFLNNTENSLVVPQRFRFGDTAEEDDWTTGVAGFIDCYDTAGGILAATILGPYLVIYKTDGIVLLEYNAAATPVFDKTPRITGSQFFATKAITSANNIDYYLARDNVYAFSGLHEAQKIGDPIRDELLASLDFSKKSECFGYIQAGKHRITFVVPAKAVSTYTYWYTYDFMEKTWSKGKWADYITCAGNYEGGAVLTWGQLKTVGTLWSAMTGAWGDLVQEKEDKTILLGDSAGYVYQLADTLNNYDDAAIDAEWHTKDFALSPDYMARSMRYGKVSFVAYGDRVSVSYSTDEGNTWTNLLTDQDLTNEREDYNISLNFSAPRCRFKFFDATSKKNFHISQVSVEYMAATTRE